MQFLKTPSVCKKNSCFLREKIDRNMNFASIPSLKNINPIRV